MADDSQAIVGGTSSTPEQDATVLLNEKGMPSCTGVLLAPNLVVTARHCITYFNRNDPCGLPFRGELPTSHITVSVGVHASPQSWVARATKFYVPTTSSLCGSDIALIALDDDITDVKPVSLRFAPTSIDEVATAVGYGDRPGRKQRTDVKVLAIGPLRTSYVTADGYKLPVYIDPHEVMTSESTCWGDSGGPLFDASGTLIAVAARGIDDRCRDRPTIWTTVNGHEQLIRQAATAVGHALQNDMVPPPSTNESESENRGIPSASGENQTERSELPPEKRKAQGVNAVSSGGCSIGPSAESSDATFGRWSTLWLAIATVLLVRGRRAVPSPRAASARNEEPIQ